MKGQDFLTAANLIGADFDAKTLEFRVIGDMPPIVRGSYVIVEAKRFDSVSRQAQLWRDAQ